jgi:serine/threonine protein kinase HipA of HipAB toxin-antitoxin module
MQVSPRRRFDREGSARIPFLSAVSMLDARDNEARSYLEFVDALRQHGAAPKQDMQALWRRIVFSILISNTDDHLRNHGFLWIGHADWRLSTAFDLNPVPTDIGRNRVSRIGLRCCVLFRADGRKCARDRARGRSAFEHHVLTPTASRLAFFRL